MKTKQQLKVIILLSGLSLIPCIATSQTKGEKPPESQSIVFVPNKMLTENKLAGKLKENTFYWSNLADDAKQGPKAEHEEGKPFLRIKGLEVSAGKKTRTITTMLRVYNVSNAKTATMTLELRAQNNAFEDTNPKANVCHARYTFLKDTLETSWQSTTPNTTRFAEVPSDKQWHTTKCSVQIPDGAQQLIVYTLVDATHTLDLGNLEVAFSNE